MKSRFSPKYVTVDYVGEASCQTKFGENPSAGNFWTKGWNIGLIFGEFIFFGPLHLCRNCATQRTHTHHLCTHPFNGQHSLHDNPRNAGTIAHCGLYCNKRQWTCSSDQLKLLNTCISPVSSGVAITSILTLCFAWLVFNGTFSTNRLYRAVFSLSFWKWLANFWGDC